MVGRARPAHGAAQTVGDTAPLAFLHPLLVQLDAQVDRRLVRTFTRTIDAILCFRSRPHGLLLNELGAYPGDPAHAPAGAKRLSNLLRCSEWSSHLMEEFLWHQASAELAVLEDQEKEALVLWAGGGDNGRIAAQLGLSEQTVRNYLSHLYRKLGMTSRFEAAMRFRNGDTSGS